MNWSKSLEDFPQQEDNNVEKPIEDLEQGTNNFDSSKKPQMEFNHETGVFEYANKAMQKIHDLRRQRQAKEYDPLESKQRELAQGLRDIGFSEKDMGKTGDSITGQVTEKHRKIAASQIEDTKQWYAARKITERN